MDFEVIYFFNNRKGSYYVKIESVDLSPAEIRYSINYQLKRYLNFDFTKDTLEIVSIKRLN